MTKDNISNEQSVIAAEAKIEKLKNDYMSILKPVVVNVQANNIEPTLDQLLDCQSKANSYFNFTENFVGSSGLLVKHRFVCRIDPVHLASC